MCVPQANPYLLNKSLGWVGTARLIYAERGYKGFMRGLTPCTLRAVPACAALFTTVDVTRSYLSNALDT